VVSISSVPRAARSTADSGDWPPNWTTFQHGIGVGRYIDPAFAKLEYEKLWKNVWQVAARLDEIPEVGHYTVYDIGNQSVMLVRADVDTVKAYRNACPHRGTALADGCGSFPNQRIVCPFHGWRWDLNGNNKLVLDRQEFRGGELQDSDVALRQLPVVVFAGFIFIHFQSNPPSFDEYIAPVRQWLEDFNIGAMRHYWWKSIRIPANWKIAQEAFMEAYHVPATHPQLDDVGREVVYGDLLDGAMGHHNVAYEAMPNGHGRFFAGTKSPMKGHVPGNNGDLLERMIARLTLNAEGMDAMILQEDVDVLKTLRGKPIPEGSTVGTEYIKALYERAAEQQRPMPKMTPEVLGNWGGEFFLFPNFLILPNAGNCEFYRSRPDGNNPDSCIFEVWSSKTYPAAVKSPRAVLEHVSMETSDQGFLLVPQQDLSNIPRIQKGLHQGMRQTWLAREQEKMILNMHQELDRYLKA
jgi:phenylpropionate dioxygenase-like ring-hydroxylating dioxygenase large terminal subunit